MDDSLAGKTLLILGGTKQACDAVEVAHELGVRVIVADYYADSPAKKIADEATMHSTFDVDGIVELCKEKNVDGVMTVANEAVLSHYYAICHRLGLPCYITPEQIDAFTKKDVFKALNKACGLATIPEYTVDETFLDRLDQLEFPVVIKPSDNSASRGVSVCYEASEVPAALEKAREFSLGGSILAEKFMRCEDLIINYTFIDGEYRLSQMGDRFVSNVYKGTGSVTSALIYPSIHIREYLETTHPLVCEMFRKTGIRDGVMFIQAFYEDGKFYCYDPGYRTCGAQVYKMLTAANDFRQMEMLIRHALTGSMGGVELFQKNDPTYGGRAACNMAILLKPGKVGSIRGVDKIKALPSVVYFTQFVEVGDEITQVGTLKQTFARMHYLCDNRRALKQSMYEVYDLLNVCDENGENMLLPHFDPEKIPI